MRANRTKNSASVSFGGSPRRNDGSFLEGGQCAVRRRIDCLRGFTMKWHSLRDGTRQKDGGREKKETRRNQRETERASKGDPSRVEVAMG